VVGTACVANQCNCNGGQAVTGAACTSNGLTACASCGDGYYKSGNSCLYHCDCSPASANTAGTYAQRTACADDGNDSGCGNTNMADGWGDCDDDSDCVNHCGTDNCPWGTADGDDCCTSIDD
jgi:hypothetical protein